MNLPVVCAECKRCCLGHWRVFIFVNCQKQNGRQTSTR